MRSLIAFLAFLIVYQLLFWQQSMGLNLMLFGWAISFFSLIRDKPPIKPYHLLLIILSLLSGVAVLLVNSTFSIIMFFVIITALNGSRFVASASVFESFGNSFLNFFNPRSGLVPGAVLPERTPKLKGALYLRVAVLPVLILFIYILLFSAGNSVFNTLGGDLLKKIQGLFIDFSFPHFMFIILGIIIIRWFFQKKWFQPIRLPVYNELRRKTSRFTYFKNLDLKYEYLTALILFALLNLLFLVVNTIDIKWVWFQFRVPEAFSLKDFVHEGVGWLIFTLLISIGLIMHYFRGNLNRYPGGRMLKILGHIWIAQNAILAISVMLRTYYYIDFHGLASKRIGVLIFLTMVLFGLASLTYKIVAQRNNFYILRVNSAFIIAALVVSSLIPWNRVIVNHNLTHHNPHEIDVDNYLDLDPQIYPILFANLDVIEDQIEAHKTNANRWIFYEDIENFITTLDLQSEAYMKDRQKVNFASWSLADQNAERKLAELGF